MEAIEIHLHTPQLKKLKDKKTFQVSHEQYKGKTGKHHVGLIVSKHHHKKFLNNIKNNKGFRFSPNIIHGTGWWDDIKSEAS